MHRNLLRPGIPLLCFVLIFAYHHHILLAQTREEMMVLSMFYKEKDLVVTPTRHPKPISQVAENITIVTSKEIEEMNAHTVAEVLNRVTGLFVNFNQDFGATSLLLIQGSEQRHVLLLVDGIPWNFMSDGAAETNSIPVGIIERMEIIKGPASSTWGSSLGGVINILTKPTGDTQTPSGSLRASIGERETQDYRAEIAGRKGAVSYYLFGARQDSDGLRFSRYFDNKSLYSKLKIPFSENVEAGLSLGYSQPNVKLGDFPAEDLTSTFAGRTFFATFSLDAFITRGLSATLSLYKFNQKSILMNNTFGLGFTGPAGELYLGSISGEKTRGGKGKLVWESAMHTLVFGLDFDQGELGQTFDAGQLLQLLTVS